MPTTWDTVYIDVCNILLESPDGLSLGLLTEPQFFQLAGEVIADISAKTGIVRKIFNTQINAGVSTYPLDDNMAELQGCVAAGSYLFDTNDFMLSNYNDQWSTWTNNPESYKQDDIDPRKVLLEPIPNKQGYQIVVDSGSGAYGTIASTSNAVDFNLEPSFLTPEGYGTISGAGGNPYLETVNPGYGVIAAMVPSSGNLSKYGIALPDNISDIGKQTYIELIPDSMVPYLKYGILARVFSSDDELRDVQKAAYCQSRYSEAISLTAAMMDMMYDEQ